MFEYVSTVFSTQSGALAFFFPNTPGANNPVSFSEVRQVSPSVTAPFRADRVFLHTHCTDDVELFWTELDSATVAGARQTIQYILTGFPSASSIGAVSQGYMNVWYRIELYQPAQSQGFTARLHSKEEAAFLDYALALFRNRSKEDASEKKSSDEGFEVITQKGSSSCSPALEASKASGVSGLLAGFFSSTQPSKKA
jgi:hypothetical protein